MAKTKSDQTPKDEEILSYTNVPVSVAAAYLGISSQTVRDGLSQRIAPYGYAIQNQQTGTWTFHISPGALVNYQNGVLNGLNLTNAIEIMATEIERLLSARSMAALEVLATEFLEVNKISRKLCKNPHQVHHT